MRSKKAWYALLVCVSLFGGSCKDTYDADRDPLTYGETYFQHALKTDKAVYKPGEQVQFSLNNSISGNFTVSYTHLGTVIKEEKLPGSTWSWAPPADDYKGYLVYVYKSDDPSKKPLYSIAVDVSSEWTKFPR